MLTALVLICSVTATPDLRACDRDTAVHVMLVPEEFGNPAMCFMHGQAFAADTAMGRDLAESERIKVVCMPSKRAHAAGVETR
jgi:hypothetical protein